MFVSQSELNNNSFQANEKKNLAHLPSQGYNTGIVIPLNCACPPACQNCQMKRQSGVAKNWYHKSCSKQSYINQFGDIFCDNHFNAPQKCQGYFIKDAQFNCSSQRDHTWYSYSTAAEFFMAIAQGMQAAEFKLNENDILEFAQSLKEIVQKRWNQ